VGRARAIDKNMIDVFTWKQANAEELPFASRSFDAVTIAFGLRNVAKIDDALAEFARVLKPGGRFFCMEFAPVEAPGLKDIYDTYSFSVLPFLGEKIANDRGSYQYLAESIRQFPKPAVLAARMEAAGFTAVTHTPLTGGIVNIHEGIRV
jgi:demethylmenaquinone methyltransferase / 2-methoxy-6-polyprenyl-1,4-benzoquinol methylase